MLIRQGLFFIARYTVRLYLESKHGFLYEQPYLLLASGQLNRADLHWKRIYSPIIKKDHQHWFCQKVPLCILFLRFFTGTFNL